MIRRSATNCLTALRAFLVVSGLIVSGATAAEPVRTEVFLTSAAGARTFSLVSVTGGSAINATPHLDYALFATELAAYLTKEILPDSSEEFGDSPLGSRWTRSMSDSNSQFGDHCLKVVASIGSAVPMPSFGSVTTTSPSTAEYVLRGATAALALRQVWDAFTNDVQGNRTGVSLRPKVSSRRVAVNVTLHW